MDEIERLEIRIEELREAIARSRRLRLVGLASAVIGPALVVGFVLGLVDYSPTRVIVAFALAIGGMVLMGSSRSSTEELERALRQAEAERIAAEAKTKLEDFVARRTKTAESKIALAEAQAVADVRSAAANAAVIAASTILSQSVKGQVADDLLAKGITEVRQKLN